MKLMKVAPALAVALFAVIAWSSSASATVCSGSGTGEVCKNAAHGRHWTGTFDATSTETKLTITTSEGAITVLTCSASTIGGQVSNATTGTATVTSISISGCTQPGCEKLSYSFPRAGGTPLPWPATITSSGLNDTNGVMHVSSFSLKFSFTCFGLPDSCEYEAASATGEFKGGAPASIVFNGVPLEKKAGTGFFCGTKADWSGTYTVSTPTSLYLE